MAVKDLPTMKRCKVSKILNISGKMCDNNISIGELCCMSSINASRFIREIMTFYIIYSKRLHSGNVTARITTPGLDLRS